MAGSARRWVRGGLGGVGAVARISPEARLGGHEEDGVVAGSRGSFLSAGRLVAEGIVQEVQRVRVEALARGEADYGMGGVLVGEPAPAAVGRQEMVEQQADDGFKALGGGGGAVWDVLVVGPEQDDGLAEPGGVLRLVQELERLPAVALAAGLGAVVHLVDQPLGAVEVVGGLGGCQDRGLVAEVPSGSSSFMVSLRMETSLGQTGLFLSIAIMGPLQSGQRWQLCWVISSSGWYGWGWPLCCGGELGFRQGNVYVAGGPVRVYPVRV